MLERNISEPQEFVGRCKILKQQRIDELQSVHSSSSMIAAQSSPLQIVPSQFQQQSGALQAISNTTAPQTLSGTRSNSNSNANPSSVISITSANSTSNQSQGSRSGNAICRKCGSRECCMVLLPCAHLCLCEMCSRVERRCPLCSQHITSVVRTYT